MSDEKPKSMNPTPVLLLEVKRGQAQEFSQRFADTFVIGRTRECGFQLSDDGVSRRHAELSREGGQWMVRDLGSTNGTLLNGQRVQEALLPDSGELELGAGGPILTFTIERPRPPKPEPAPPTTTDFASETQILRKLTDSSSPEGPGEQTLMLRRAFDRVHKKKSRKYLYVIGAVASVAVIILAVTAGMIHHKNVQIRKQEEKIAALRKTAENIYYAMKGLEVQIGQLEDIVMLSADQAQLKDLQEKHRQLEDMVKEYDSFVSQIGVYRKSSPERQLIYKMSRTFGECDVNVPEGFVVEVLRYINIWKSSGLLKRSLEQARNKGYDRLIVRTLKQNNLPKHFMFIALRESDFNPMAVGRQTRYGYAKGMWQFIPGTAQQYGLKIGPFYRSNSYDPYDERFYVPQASRAAARYIRDLRNTQAQASGLLVLASYNWGDGNVRAIISRMPGNPRDRNFWRLLQAASVPKETYDYVYSIFSAAVICENPRLFGFDFDPPRLGDEG
jgi:membrane-bound lytic murein transglycosylase D